MSVNGKNVDSKNTLSVTVPAGGETELNLAITAPAGADDLSQFGGYLRLDAVQGRGHLSIPYIGFKGDYQKIPVLTDAAIFGDVYPFPTLAQNTADGLDFGGPKRTYTLGNSAGGATDRPFILAHFNHQARKANFDALKADGSVAAELDRDQYTPRNAQFDYEGSGDDVWFKYSLGRQRHQRQDPAAQRRLQAASARSQGAGRREQPRRLGRVRFAGLCHQAQVSQPSTEALLSGGAFLCLGLSEAGGPSNCPLPGALD